MTILNSIMRSAIDYAGTFPPAVLSPIHAQEQFAGYLAHEHCEWLSGRMVLSPAQLGELTSQPLINLVLPLAYNLDVLKPNSSIRAIEALVPEDQPLQYLNSLQNAFPEAQIFAEIPYSDFGKRLIACLQNTTFCAKFRTGSVHPKQIPSSEVLAECLILCAQYQVPFKATAGLHQPAAHRFEGVAFFGFLNLFAAAALCWRGEKAIPIIAHCLTGLETHNFSFYDNMFTAGRWQFSESEMYYLRKNFALSFGSCSFLEPVEALIANYFGEIQ